MSYPEWATELAVKIAQHWSAPDTAEAWERFLADLDEGRAGTTWSKLKRDREMPSWDRWRQVYGERRMHDGGTRPRCTICDGVGFVDGPQIVKTDRAGEVVRTYTTQQECVCTTRRREEGL